MVDLTAGSRRLTCDLVERNSLAVAFQALRVATPELAGATSDESGANGEVAFGSAHLS